MVSRLAYWDTWNWNRNYNYFSVGNDSLRGTTLPHNEFHLIIFDEQQGELSWSIQTQCTSQCMAHVGSREHVTRVITRPEEWAADAEVSSANVGAAGTMTCESHGAGERCGRRVVRMHGDGEIWMCLAWGVTLWHHISKVSNIMTHFLWLTHSQWHLMSLVKYTIF